MADKGQLCAIIASSIVEGKCQQAAATTAHNHTWLAEVVLSIDMSDSISRRGRRLEQIITAGPLFVSQFVLSHVQTISLAHTSSVLPQRQHERRK